MNSSYIFLYFFFILNRSSLCRCRSGLWAVNQKVLRLSHMQVRLIGQSKLSVGVKCEFKYACLSHCVSPVIMNSQLMLSTQRAEMGYSPSGRSGRHGNEWARNFMHCMLN